MKFYYTLTMAHLFYHLGDIASKPLNMDWAQEDGPYREWIAGKISSVYNYLMLKSVDFNDAGDHDVWGPCESDDEDAEDAFTPMVFTKKDEK